MKLVPTFLKGIKADGKPQKHSDGGGLYLYVSPTGGKLWRMDYRFDGKRKTLSFGAYPAVSLKDARQRREETKELLAKGIDPSAHKKAVKLATQAENANSYEVVTREWVARQSSNWTELNATKVLSRQANYIFPFLGNRPISQISAPELLAALRRIEEKGVPYTAKRTLQNCGQIFRYAIATGRAERDISADLRGALTPAVGTNFASIKEPKAIGVMLRDLSEYPNIIVRAALCMAPYVFVRPGELRKAEWTEFDFEAAEWRIPAVRMKMRQLHIVPLARQVLDILNNLRPYTGDSKYLFPSMRAKSAPISDVTLLAGLRRLGYDKDEMTVHGFRSMASTLLNEKGYNRDWIERQLAHGERNSVRSKYNYAEYLPERRKMMQEWADYLDSLREANSSANIE